MADVLTDAAAATLRPTLRAAGAALLALATACAELPPATQVVPAIAAKAAAATAPQPAVTYTVVVSCKEE